MAIDLKDILERGYCPLCKIFRTTEQGDDRPRRLMAHMAAFQRRDVKHAELYDRLKTVYTVPRRTKCPPWAIRREGCYWVVRSLNGRHSRFYREWAWAWGEFWSRPTTKGDHVA